MAERRACMRVIDETGNRYGRLVGMCLMSVSKKIQWLTVIGTWMPSEIMGMEERL